jgi:hypothetical protein
MVLKPTDQLKSPNVKMSGSGSVLSNTDNYMVFS